MTKEEYLYEVRKYLESINVGNTDDVVKVFEDRFNLGKDAGMSEDDIANFLGNPKNAVRKYLNLDKEENAENGKEEDFNKDSTLNFEHYKVEIGSVFIDEIDIVEEDIDHIHVNIDEDITEYLSIEKSNHELRITDKSGGSKGVFVSKNRSGSLRLSIPRNTYFDRLVIRTVNGDVNIDNVVGDTFKLENTSGDVVIKKVKMNTINLNTVNGDFNIQELKANNVNISAVNGDYKIKNIICGSASVSTVNGDYDIEYMKADVLKCSTISGDITIRGNVKEKHWSRISGDVNYTELK